ncbi:MAG TPA: APC family permease [Candidatus Sulfotelmatobacter sp.]|nr:APC family permease [Candidatus Sulfotelmatobacter sp.]
MATKTPTVPGVFTRASSGLVRSVSTLDAVYYGVMAITVAYMVFIVAAIPNYVGASIEWSTVITMVGAIALGLVYALFAAVYPRSGGEYVFLSRTVHPLVGFVISFEQTFWYAFYFGVNGAFFSIYGLAPLFTALGLQTKSQGLQSLGTFFTQPLGIFLGGTVMVFLIGGLVWRGMRGYFRFQRWGGTIALGSVLLTILVFALGAAGVLHFQQAFDGLAGNGAYNTVIAGAQKAGQELSWSTQLGPTLNFMIWPAFALLFSVNMVSFSGEIKNVRRGQLIGILGAMIVSALLMIGLTYFGRHAVGTQFLVAASSTPADKFPLPVAPYLNNFAAILSNNPLMTVLMSFWVVLVIPYALGSNVIYGSRALFAWGLDGVAPSKVGSVSDRFHSPAAAILVMVVAAEIALVIFAFTAWVAILSGLLGFVIAFFVVSLTGLVFPFRNREVFENSPAAIRVAGVPLLTIASVVAIPFLAFLIWRTFVDQTYGASTTISIVVNIVVFLVGIAWFLGARAYRKQRGVDVDRQFKEIPVE